MNGKFLTMGDVEPVALDWSIQRWLSRPDLTGAQSLLVVEVAFKQGMGHSFHKHPNQEEVIYVVEGEIEQWLEQEKRVLKAGEAVFIHADVVHASFGLSTPPAKALAILSPGIGAEGYEVVDVFEDEPWKSLRT